MSTDAAPLQGTSIAVADPPAPAAATELTSRHDLPDGQWVEVRDYRTLSNGDRRRVLKNISDAQAATAIARGYDMQDALLAAIIVAWSLPHPIPSQDMTVFDELDIATGVAVEDLAKEPMRVLFPRTDVNPDPKSPTQPSSDSVG